MLLKLNRIFSGQKLTILGDKQQQTDKPAIYACTHVGRYDIKMAPQVIGNPCWFFMGGSRAGLPEF